MKLLITGTTGFIGSTLCQRIATQSPTEIEQAFVMVRSPESTAKIPSCPTVEPVVFPSLPILAQGKELLAKVDCVIHLAARVHQMKDTASDPLSAFRAVNTQATYELAQAAAEAGVRRFIFLSTIKVNGEETTNTPFTADDPPNPHGFYGISKYEAEVKLQNLVRTTGMEIVIIRPPLVYGAGVKANFFKMMQWLDQGIPLPFGAVNNRRSLVSCHNLVDLILTCTTNPNAANQIFLVSDGEDISTTELLKRTARALNKPAKLLPVPVEVLNILGTISGQQERLQRLCSSLQVDITKTKKMLDWSPPASIDETLAETIEYFFQHRDQVIT